MLVQFGNETVAREKQFAKADTPILIQFGNGALVREEQFMKA